MKMKPEDSNAATLEQHNDKLLVTPDEACVEGIHVNLRTPRAVTVLFAEQPVNGNLKNGWLKANRI